MKPEHDDKLAVRLRQEASDSRPEFSDALHARVLEAISRSQTTEQSLLRDSASPRAYIRRVLPAAVVAASIIAAIMAGWLTTRKGSGVFSGPATVAQEERLPTPISRESASDAELLSDLADQATDGISIALDSTVASQKSAYLDDFQLVTDTLIDRVPTGLLASDDR
jgi:hypothetical protein